MLWRCTSSPKTIFRVAEPIDTPYFTIDSSIIYVAAGYLEAERNVLIYQNCVSLYEQGCATHDRSYRRAHIVLWIEKQKTAVSY